MQNPHNHSTVRRVRGVISVVAEITAADSVIRVESVGMMPKRIVCLL